MTNFQVFQLQGNYNLDSAKKTVSEKLNQSWIEQRTVGKTTLSYIGGHVVIRLLNKAFNYQWSFEIVKEEVVQSIPKFNKYAKQGQPTHEAQPPVVKVLGRLTVPGLGVKEQYGSKVLIGGASEQESAFKSASTDALKKCASLFGIGLDLYGAVEGFEEDAYQEYVDAPTPQAPVQPTAPVNAPPYQAPQAPAQENTPFAGHPASPAPEAPPVVPLTEQYQTASQAQADGNLAAQQGGTVLTPNVQEQPQGAATSGPARSFAWPPAEVEKLRTLKETLGVSSNAQLDPYVREFLNNQEVTIQNITPDNITAFNVFLQSKLS